VPDDRQAWEVKNENRSGRKNQDKYINDVKCGETVRDKDKRRTGSSGLIVVIDKGKGN
jgi:hypothetical protein